MEEEEGLFRRFTETHLQRGYTLPVMQKLIEKAGMVFETAIDMDTGKEPSEKSERICMIAREKGKIKQ